MESSFEEEIIVDVVERPLEGNYRKPKGNQCHHLRYERVSG